MKANAPEKIFICDYGSDVGYEWHSESKFEAKGHNDIEYTRTDAFINDVCKWLKENAYLYVNDYTGSLNEDKLIEDFRKNFMKGE